MVQQDKIFAALGSIGTPTAMAAMPIYLDAKVAHLFPLTGARQMFEPLHDLKYSFSAPYYDQIRACDEAGHQGQGPEEGLRGLPGRRFRAGSARRAASMR